MYAPVFTLGGLPCISVPACMVMPQEPSPMRWEGFRVEMRGDTPVLVIGNVRLRAPGFISKEVVAGEAPLRHTRTWWINKRTPVYEYEYRTVGGQARFDYSAGEWGYINSSGYVAIRRETERVYRLVGARECPYILMKLGYSHSSLVEGYLGVEPVDPSVCAWCISWERGYRSGDCCPTWTHHVCLVLGPVGARYRVIRHDWERVEAISV